MRRVRAIIVVVLFGVDGGAFLGLEHDGALHLLSARRAPGETRDDIDGEGTDSKPVDSNSNEEA